VLCLVFGVPWEYQHPAGNVFNWLISVVSVAFGVGVQIYDVLNDS
jgi:hypothetical protein